MSLQSRELRRSRPRGSRSPRRRGPLPAQGRVPALSGLTGECPERRPDSRDTHVVAPHPAPRSTATSTARPTSRLAPLAGLPLGVQRDAGIPTRSVSSGLLGKVASLDVDSASASTLGFDYVPTDGSQSLRPLRPLFPRPPRTPLRATSKAATMRPHCSNTGSLPPTPQAHEDVRHVLEEIPVCPYWSLRHL